MSELWLLDNSAWTRRLIPGLPRSSVDALADDIEEGRLVVSPPFRLEAGYSARNNDEYTELMKLLDSFPSGEFGSGAVERSLDAQAQLARTGHHRVPPIDILIAAIADLEGIGVLHYDAHYDSILEKTDLAYESRWLAEKGSL